MNELKEEIIKLKGDFNHINVDDYSYKSSQVPLSLDRYILDRDFKAHVSICIKRKNSSVLDDTMITDSAEKLCDYNNIENAVVYKIKDLDEAKLFSMFNYSFYKSDIPYYIEALDNRHIISLDDSNQTMGSIIHMVHSISDIMSAVNNRRICDSNKNSTLFMYVFEIEDGFYKTLKEKLHGAYRKVYLLNDMIADAWNIFDFKVDQINSTGKKPHKLNTTELSIGATSSAIKKCEHSTLAFID